MIPINVDKNASPRDYPTDKLLVTSAFYTFQGEGPHAGKPAVFLRLAGCNIGAKEDCPWCDTKFDLASAQARTLESVCEELNDLGPHCRLIVITGGEPLLQWPMIRELILRIPKHKLQIETNGLLLSQDIIADCINFGVDVVWSPKIPHNRDTYRLISASKLWGGKKGSLLSLKYVVTSDAKSPYHHVPQDAIAAHGLGVPVYISGMTVYRRPLRPGEVASIWNSLLIDQEATAANYEYASRLALDHGFCVSFQTHLFGSVE
jgi:7-carboxy-7-deazaguanine synthase